MENSRSLHYERIRTLYFGGRKEIYSVWKGQTQNFEGEVEVIFQ